MFQRGRYWAVLLRHKLYDCHANTLFSFVFVNLYHKERQHLFQEGPFCFICMQNSCFYLNI